MSKHGIELALWEAAFIPGKADQLREQADSYLAAYNVTEEEKGLIKAWNLEVLAERGVDGLILLNSWNAVRGPTGNVEFMQRMNPQLGGIEQRGLSDGSNQNG